MTGILPLRTNDSGFSLFDSALSVLTASMLLCSAFISASGIINTVKKTEVITSRILEQTGIEKTEK